MADRFIIVAVVLALSGALAAAAPAGDFNAAPFGTTYVLSNSGTAPTYDRSPADGSAETVVELPAGAAVQVEWRQPRDVYAVGLTFDGPAPRANDVTVSYWYHVWPDNGGGGWMGVDDPFNGRFVSTSAEPAASGPNDLTFRFRPLDQAENPDIKETGHVFRRTYKVRVSFKQSARLAELACLTDSNWRTASVLVEWPGREWKGQVEARNGHIVSTSVVNSSSLRIEVRYADNPARPSPDRGHVVVRRAEDNSSFSFFVDDVLREGTIFVRDVNAFVSDAGRGLSQASWRRPAEAWDATVMEKVAAMPEQTIERAASDIPPKWVPPAHLGLPYLRQEVSIDDRSQIYTDYRSMRSPGPDVDRSPNLSAERPMRLYVRVTRSEPFGPPGPKRIKRWLEEGYLPVIHSQWQDDNIDYHQTIFATSLDPAVPEKCLTPPAAAGRAIGTGIHAADFGAGVTGNESVAALCRLDVANPTAEQQTATMWLKITHRPPMRIDSDGLLVLEAPTRPSAGEGLTPTWGQIDTQGRGELAYLKDFFPEQTDRGAPRDVIRYTLQLAPHAEHAIFMKVPVIEQLTAQELQQLRHLTWDAACRQIVDLWKRRLADAVEDYQVPEPALMNLYRANLWHVLITTDRDPPTGLYEHGAGTYDYPVYPNETMMVARSLDMRGEHEEARRLIEPCLLSQGARALPGNFKSKEGLLYATAPPGYDHYTAQGYNMHHGFILWAAAEHFFWAHDRQYLTQIAPNLVAGCDWIIRERQATKVLNPDGTRPIEWGLAPAGDLEDVKEYLYWYATNAYYYLGMKTAARALAEIDHPQAGRLASEAAAYATDIMNSVRESAATSPVVRLLDGSYVPYVPPRAYALTDRKEGWIRESLYCALHLTDCELLDPRHPFTTWILDELEDRIFMSPESGFGPGTGLHSPAEQFFSYGGFNPQPNLLDNSIAYLKRGQVPNFLRAFWNTYTMSLHPDIQCFAESVSFGMGGGPLYKTPDECKFIQWMRQMLVLETDGDLHLARGVPRAWLADGKTIALKQAPTHFGPMDLKITSAVGQRRITVSVRLPDRKPIGAVHLTLRHPDGTKIRSVTADNQEWSDFDAQSETIRLPRTTGQMTLIVAY